MVQARSQRIGAGPVLSLLPAPRERDEALPSHPDLARLSLDGGRLSGDFACGLGNLPIRSESVRLIIVRHVLDLLDEDSPLASELTRLLMPGGTLMVFGLNPLSPWRLWSMRHARNGVRMPRHHRASRIGRLLKRLHLDVDERAYLGGAWPVSRTDAVLGSATGSGTQWDAAWMLVAHKPGVAIRLVGIPSRNPAHAFGGGLAQLPSRRARA